MVTLLKLIWSEQNERERINAMITTLLGSLYLSEISGGGSTILKMFAVLL